jgi:hypothetical protein
MTPKSTPRRVPEISGGLVQLADVGVDEHEPGVLVELSAGVRIAQPSRSHAPAPSLTRPRRDRAACFLIRTEAMVSAVR